MAEFKRENRYAVFKLKNLTTDQLQRLYELQMELGPHSDVKECVVVEHDWPNYEHVWRTVEQVANGTWRETPTAAVEVLQTLLALHDAQVDTAYVWDTTMEEARTVIENYKKGVY